jgi:hypothetical protein
VEGLRAEFGSIKTEVKDLKGELKGEVNKLKQEVRDLISILMNR